MSIQNTTLIISNKETMSTPTQVSTAMRQIERWSQQHNYNQLTLTADFTPGSAPYSPLVYLVDPLGFVHLHGRVNYGGGIPADQTIIALLPTNISPQTVYTWPGDISARIGFFQIVPNVGAPATFWFRTSTGVTYPSNPDMLIDFIYDPRI